MAWPPRWPSRSSRSPGCSAPRRPARWRSWTVPAGFRANIDGFRVVLDPLVEHLRESGRAPAPGSVVATVGSRITGVQAGLILAYLAGRVLGQYELFLPPDPAAPEDAAPAGRLTLVAPNIVMVERELGVNVHDFRRWVCLHEETHRTQFTAVSWLRGYVQQQMTDFLLASELDPATILNRLRSAADAVAGAVRGNGHGGQPHRGHPDPRAAGDPRPADLRHDAGGRPRRLRHGRRRPAGGAHGRRDQGAVQRPPVRRGAGRADHPPDPGHRPEDEAVRAGFPLRPDGGAGGGDGRLQPGVDVAGDAPGHRRARGPATLAGPGRRQRWSQCRADG